MDVDLDQAVIAALTVIVLIAACSIPVAIIVGLLWVSRRRLSGKRGRFDGLFSGVGRGNAMNSHLRAGTPDPDELAIPQPGPRRRRRRQGS